MGTRSANEKANNNFAGIYGGTGVQTLDANFDKSFVTPVRNFVVVSPGTIS